MVVKLDTGDLLPSGKTALEVTHDQESERRIRSGVEDDWAEPWRAVQDESGGAKAVAAGGILQAPQRLRARSCVEAGFPR